MAFICKQPNGLYCRFSNIVDCPTHWNMTENDYVQMCMERAKEEALDTIKNHLKPFEWVSEYFYPHNMTKKEFAKILNEMSKEAQ